MIVWGILEFQLVQIINMTMRSQEESDRYFMEEDCGYFDEVTQADIKTLEFVTSCVESRVCAKLFYKKALGMIIRWEERRKGIAEQYREKIRTDIASGKMEFYLCDDKTNTKTQMPVEYADKIEGLPESWQWLKEALAEAFKK